MGTAVLTSPIWMVLRLLCCIEPSFFQIFCAKMLFLFAEILIHMAKDAFHQNVLNALQNDG